MLGGRSSVTSGGSNAGALGEWKFDEGYGDTANNIGNGGSSLNGDLAGSGTTCPQSGDSACPTWSNEGKYGKALDFEDSGTTDDYVDIGSGTDINIDEGDFTLSAWVNLESIGTDRCIICQGDAGGSRAIELRYDHGDTRFEFDVNASGWKYAKFDQLVPPSLSTWYHVVGVRDGSIIKIYVNGAQGATTAAIGTITNMDSDSWSIGRDGDSNGRYWDGQIDEAKIYNFALTDDQIRLLYNGSYAASFGALSTASSSATINSSARSYCPPGDTGTCNPPVAEWKLDEKTGSTAYDTSGNGNTGTINSCVWKVGKFGQGLQFTPPNSYVDVGSASILNITNTVSISSWVYFNSITGSQYFVSKGSYSTYAIGKANDNRFRVEYKDQTGTSHYVFSTTTAVTNNWYFIEATIQAGGRVKLYVNSIQEADQAFVGTSLYSDPSNVATLGTQEYSVPGSSVLEGILDEAKIYNYIRTPAQIAWDYNRGAPIAWYKFDECTGATAYNNARAASGEAAGMNGTIDAGTSGQLTVGDCSTNANTMWYNGRNGKYSSALSFDNNDDYVSFGDTSYTDGLTAMTISLWVKPIYLNQASLIISKFDYNNQNSFAVLTDPFVSSELQVSISNSLDDYNTHCQTSGFGLTQGEWNHVTVIYDGTQTAGNRIKAYRNGINKSLTSCGSIPTSMTTGSTSNLKLGNGDFAGWDGLYAQHDDLKIWNYALTAEQIKTEYNGGAVHFGP
jgi:hypothetical protein